MHFWMLGAKYRNAKTILLYSIEDFVANMAQGKQEISPLEKWYEAGKNDPKIGASLRLLLGHALVAVFRNNRPVLSIFSPEKAISLAQRLPKGILPEAIGTWLAHPEKYAKEILHFCEKSRELEFPTEIDLSGFSTGAVDMRGVRCPTGSVRARLVLAGMEPGDLVTFWIDDGEPIENVPRAMVEDGNHIVFREKRENYWELRVQKREIK